MAAAGSSSSRVFEHSTDLGPPRRALSPAHMLPAPDIMLVAAVSKPGPAEAIKLLQKASPQPGKWVLVEQHASSVNPIGEA